MSNNDPNPMLTNCRLKVTGDIVELLEFTNPMYLGPKTRKKTAKKREAGKKLKKNLVRTMTTVIDLINCNAFQYYPDLLHPSSSWPITPKFVTFTFKNEVTDLTYALKCFSLFNQRFAMAFYAVKKLPAKYLCVYEVQKKREAKYKKAVWHFHCVYFNLPWIDKNLMQDIWKHGFIDVRDLSAVGNVGFYMTKYLLKDANDPRLEGHRMYLASQNLLRPKVVRYPVLISELVRSFPASLITSETPPKESKYLGEMIRTRFNIAKDPELAKKFKKNLSDLAGQGLVEGKV
jgi:hypothetical protein